MVVDNISVGSSSHPCPPLLPGVEEQSLLGRKVQHSPYSPPPEQDLGSKPSHSLLELPGSLDLVAPFASGSEQVLQVQVPVRGEEDTGRAGLEQKQARQLKELL